MSLKIKECACFLPLRTPSGQRFWIPTVHPEPPEHITVVAHYGRDPLFLRMERVPGGGGWKTLGAAASHHEVTPPEPWEEVGFCRCKVEHPVIAVES